MNNENMTTGPEPLPNVLLIEYKPEKPLVTGTSITSESALIPMTGDILPSNIVSGTIGGTTYNDPKGQSMYRIMTDGGVFNTVTMEYWKPNSGGFKVLSYKNKETGIDGKMVISEDTGEFIGPVPAIKDWPKVVSSRPAIPDVLNESNNLALYARSLLDSSEMELLEMLTTCREAGSQTEADFIAKFIDSIPGMESDDYGNRYVIIGERPNICFSSHTDSVHYMSGTQSIHFDKGVVGLAKGSDANCLGADCATGVWLMRQMALKEIPGLYIFHRKEESGMQGANWIVANNRDLMKDTDAIIAFDRKGFDSIITHQCGSRTASKAFAKSLKRAIAATNPGSKWQPLDYKLDSGGMFTDSYAYAGLVSECTNISVGYKAQHTDGETQSLDHATKLLRAMLLLDWQSLVFERDQSGFNRFESDDSWAGGTVYKGRYRVGHLELGPAEGYGQHGAWHSGTSPYDDAGRTYKDETDIAEGWQERDIPYSNEDYYTALDLISEYPETIAHILLKEFNMSVQDLREVIAEDSGVSIDSL